MAAFTVATDTVNSFVAILDYAAQSVVAWSASAKQASRANVLSTYVLCQSFPVMTFTGEVIDKKGNVIEVLSFDLYDMLGEAWDARSNAQKNAMSNAVLAKLFSCPTDKATPAIKAGLRRSLPVALNLVNAVVSKLVSERSDLEGIQEQILESIQLRQNKSKGAEQGGYDLRVPYVILHDAPKDDASESAIEKWDAYKDKLVTCDGSKENGSYADMARAVAPKRESAGPKMAGPKSVAFDGGTTRDGESLQIAAAFLLGGNTLADTEAAEGLVDWLVHDRAQLIKAIKAYQDATNA